MAADRNSLTIPGFSGLDLTSPALSAADYRAVNGCDYVERDGSVHKRHGTASVLKVPSVRYFAISPEGTEGSVPKENGRNVNGLWKFRAEDGETHVVMHAGSLLFEVTGLGGEAPSASPVSDHSSSQEGTLVEYPACYELSDGKSQAFVGGKKLWLLGGTAYFVLRFVGGKASFLPVRKSPLVPIPTTTVGITYTNSAAGTRASFQAPNILTEWRRNSCLTGVGKRENEATATKHFEFVLDAPILGSASDMASFRGVLEERGKVG